MSKISAILLLIVVAAVIWNKAAYAYHEYETSCPEYVDPSDPETFPKYVDRLVIPQVLKPVGIDKKTGNPKYVVKAKKTTVQVHSCFPRKTKMFAFNGQFPGPTIEADRDEPITVKWVNSLPKKHILEESIQPELVHLGDNVGDDEPPYTRLTVHLHGARVADVFDGKPMAWYTRNFEKTGAKFTTNVFEYPNEQHAATLWYHDHTMGMTRVNIYSGLAGLYFIRDKKLEQKLNLPKDEFEVPLMIQDRKFKNNSQLDHGIIPSAEAGLGNTMMVNGRVWPYFEVEPRKYRFRLLNACNRRIITLGIFYEEKELKETDRPVVKMYQIASDSSFLERPLPRKRITMGPAERVEIIIDFRKYAGKTLYLRNLLPDEIVEIDDNAKVFEQHTSHVMQFKVVQSTSGHKRVKDRSCIPDHLLSRSDIWSDLRQVVNEPTVQRDILLLNNRNFKFFFAVPMLNSASNITLNDEPPGWMAMGFTDPVTETPLQGAQEVWRFIGFAVGSHPIHVHLVSFMVVEKQEYNITHFEQHGTLQFVGRPIREVYESIGLKDTILVEQGFVVSVLMRFDLAGEYVFHCHILEHEDFDMMRNYVVRERQA